MSAALGLLRLQQVDSRLDQLEDRLGLITAQLQDDAAAAAAREALASADAERQQAELARLAAEAQTSSQRNKLQLAEASLYGGTVRNPKELQDLQDDVASLKRYLAILEEAEFACMERLEVADNHRREAAELLEQILGRANVDRHRLADQQNDLNRTREQLHAERGAALSAIGDHDLEMYESLRRSRRGVAVCEVSDGACGACGTVLTAALHQSARSGTGLVHCPSCSRILFGG